VCDTEAPRFSPPLCAERIAAELGGIVDLAVTDSGDIHVLGEDGTITALRPGEELEVERFEIPGALMLTAGYRSLLVATPEGVSRHRIARGELVADVEGRPVVADRPSALALARLGRLFVAVSTPIASEAAMTCGCSTPSRRRHRWVVRSSDRGRRPCASPLPGVTWCSGWSVSDWWRNRVDGRR
jgi:hypothetical protein